MTMGPLVVYCIPDAKGYTKIPVVSEVDLVMILCRGILEQSQTQSLYGDIYRPSSHTHTHTHTHCAYSYTPVMNILVKAL